MENELSSQSQSAHEHEEFRTLVTGFRLHGQFNQAEGVFSLKVQSVQDKEMSHNLCFGGKYGLCEELATLFVSAKQLYGYLSKSTKLRLKISNSLLGIVVYDSDKKPFEVFISFDGRSVHPKEQDLLTQVTSGSLQTQSKQFDSNLDKAQDRNFSDQQLQSEQAKHEKGETVEQKGTNSNSHGTSSQLQKGSEIVEDFETPILSLEEKILKLQQERNERMAKEEGARALKKERQKQPINLPFSKSKPNEQDLYDFAFQHKIDPLLDAIEGQEILSLEQITLKKLSIPHVPPFHQVQLTQLKKLSLRENKIARIAANFDSMKGLQELTLDANKISVIENLEGLAGSLKVLRISTNSIRKIQGLDSLVWLEKLWLDFNEIDRIENLGALKNLKSLNLSFNMIQELENLHELQNLNELLLNENQIKIIKNIDALKGLTKLSLNMNAICQIQGVKKLLLLESLFLSENCIEKFDREAFEELNWLKMLKELRLAMNSIEWNEDEKGYLERVKKYGTKVSV